MYLWVNKNNHRCYVGSSINLCRRLENYFSISYLTNTANKMPIVNAILLYGVNDFHLYILEKCDSNITIKQLRIKKDSWSLLIKPSYNIQNI